MHRLLTVALAFSETDKESDPLCLLRRNFPLVAL